MKKRERTLGRKPVIGGGALKAMRILTIMGVLAVSLSYGILTAAQSGVQRPLVLVPGILGSKLCDSKGNVIWGNASSLANLTTLDQSSSGPRIALTSCGVIEDIQVLGPLWSIRQYSGLLSGLQSAGFTRDKDLFVFHYDWRQSNLKTAEELARFIERNVPTGNFDVIAHSMGGLVTKIYVQRPEIKGRIRKVIYLGTPFLGSANTFGSLSEGWGAIENVIAGGKTGIQRTILSFAGFLELLPRYKECCYIRKEDGKQLWLDPFDAAVWQRLDWLPQPIDRGEDLDVFQKNLQSAGRLSKVFQARAPAGTVEVMIAGDAYSTRRLLGMPERNTKPSGWLYSKDLGDGTVPVWSAANDVSFTDLAGTLQSFSQHSTIFDDKWVITQLRRELALVTPSRDVPIAAPTRPAIRAKAGSAEVDLTVHSVELSAARPSIFVGEQLAAELLIHLEDTTLVEAPSFHPVVHLHYGSNNEVLVATPVDRANEWVQRRMRYSISGPVTSREGVHEVSVRVGGQLSAVAYVTVLKR